jgi:hypothetical protein
MIITLAGVMDTSTIFHCSQVSLAPVVHVSVVSFIPAMQCLASVIDNGIAVNFSQIADLFNSTSLYNLQAFSLI